MTERSPTRFWARLVRDTRGADLVEWALLAGFFGLAAVAGFGNLRTTINRAYGVWDGAVQAIYAPVDPGAGGGS
ncbi:MAG: hypothetical protein U0Q12_08850 [Vicinamibacterales bacterium]